MRFLMPVVLAKGTRDGAGGHGELVPPIEMAAHDRSDGDRYAPVAGGYKHADKSCQSQRQQLLKGVVPCGPSQNYQARDDGDQCAEGSLRPVEREFKLNRIVRRVHVDTDHREHCDDYELG